MRSRAPLLIVTRALRHVPIRHVPAVLLFLLVTLTTTAASPPVRSITTGRVVGHVKDQNGAPIANAQVFIVGTALNALTDTAGRQLGSNGS